MGSAIQDQEICLFPITGSQILTHNLIEMLGCALEPGFDRFLKILGETLDTGNDRHGREFTQGTETFVLHLSGDIEK